MIHFWVNYPFDRAIPRSITTLASKMSENTCFIESHQFCSNYIKIIFYMLSKMLTSLGTTENLSEALICQAFQISQLLACCLCTQTKINKLLGSFVKYTERWAEMWHSVWHRSSGGINKQEEANEVFNRHAYRVSVYGVGHTQSGWQKKILGGWMWSNHGESPGSCCPIRRDVWLSSRQRMCPCRTRLTIPTTVNEQNTHPHSRCVTLCE